MFHRYTLQLDQAPPGTSVRILEIVDLEEYQRRRARLAHPAGWITLENMETGRWGLVFQWVALGWVFWGWAHFVGGRYLSEDSEASVDWLCVITGIFNMVLVVDVLFFSFFCVPFVCFLVDSVEIGDTSIWWYHVLRSGILFDGEKGVFLRSPKSMGESNPWGYGLSSKATR